MAYEFGIDESLADGAARIAREQLAAAVGWLAVAVDDGSDGSDAGDEAGTDADHAGDPVTTFVADEVDEDAPVEVAVHEARKCCKRVRGLVRLLRPAMEDDYQAINQAARDAARELSPIRDAHALLATFDVVVAAHADQVPAGGVTAVRDALAARAEEATDEESHHRRVDDARALLQEAEHLVNSWALPSMDADQLDQAMADGVAKTARRGRDRHIEVVEADGHPGDEALHQWRKRVKYSWYHVSLLEPAAPSLLGAHADALHDLADVLGDDHDLAILAADLRAAPGDFGGTSQVRKTLVLLDGVRHDLQRRAVSLGARMHAEDPDAFGARMVALHGAASRLGPELRAGEIDDLFGVADDLGDRTNGELRELARSRDLPGRSRLDRDGLLAALRASGAVT